MVILHPVSDECCCLNCVLVTSYSLGETWLFSRRNLVIRLTCRLGLWCN